MESFAITGSMVHGQSVASIQSGLNAIDLSIVAIYFVVTVVFGIAVSRRQETAADFFLAGRTMPWWIVGLSLFASNISSTTLVGLAGEGYASGIAVFNYEWMAGVVLVFFIIFILPSVLRAQAFTMPELLERRFNAGARVYFSLLTLFLNIVVDTAGSLYAGGLLIQVIWPSASLWVSIPALAIVAGLYTSIGGLKAVMVTDALQAAILLVGSIMIAGYAFDAAGGWSEVASSVPPERLSLVRPIDDPKMPWLGLVLGVPLLGFYFWCTNQFMTQRVLSARDLNHARWGCLFAGFLKLPVLFIMVLPGTAAAVIYPQLERADLVFPTLMLDLLPVGISGLVCAGFLAALMSQIDSTLNGAATLVTMDFVKRWRPDLSNAGVLKTGRIVTVIFMLIAVMWAPQLGRFGSLFLYLQKILAYAVPPVLSLFVVGWFWRRANSSGSNLALVVGTASGAVLFAVVEILGAVELHFLYVPPLLFALSCVLIIVGSLAKPAALSPAAADFIWRPEPHAANGLRDHRVLSVLLLAATAVLVWLFR